MQHVGATPAARGAHLPGGRVRKAVRIDMREGLAQRSAARDGRGGRDRTGANGGLISPTLMKQALRVFPRLSGRHPNVCLLRFDPEACGEPRPAAAPP